MKSPHLRHYQTCAQDKGLSEYQRRAGRQQTGPFPTKAGRQERGQPELESGKLSPRDGILHQTAGRLPVANQAFLGSWTDDICQEGCSQRSAPEKRHIAHLRWHTWETEQLGLGK